MEVIVIDHMKEKQKEDELKELREQGETQNKAIAELTSLIASTQTPTV